jgi:hypothetical protein
MPRDNDKNALIDYNKRLILFWTPRAACTCAVAIFFKHTGLLDTVLQHHQWPHRYRNIYYNNNRATLRNFKDKSYCKIKVVRNPYHRIVSCYIHYIKTARPNTIKIKNYSFFEYLNAIIKDDIPGYIYKYHVIPQASKADAYISKIVKIENIENDLKKIDKERGFNLYDSYLDIKAKKLTHITPKNENIKYFVGYLKTDEIKKIGVPDYKYFYNDQIKAIVGRIYRLDIERYGYSYPF